MVLKPVMISRATARGRQPERDRKVQPCHPSLRSGSDSLGKEILPLRCAQGFGSRAQDDMVGWTVLVALHIKVERAL